MHPRGGLRTSTKDGSKLGWDCVIELVFRKPYTIHEGVGQFKIGRFRRDASATLLPRTTRRQITVSYGTVGARRSRRRETAQFLLLASLLVKSFAERKRMSRTCHAVRV